MIVGQEMCLILGSAPDLGHDTLGPTTVRSRARAEAPRTSIAVPDREPSL